MFFFLFSDPFFNFGSVFGCHARKRWKNQLDILKENFMLDILKKKIFFLISKNQKGHPTLKIFSRATSSHLISFRFCRFLDTSWRFRNTKSHSRSRKIRFNQRKKNRAHTSRGHDLKVDPKKSLFFYITASRESPLTWGVHLLSAPPHQQHSQIVKDYIKKSKPS